MKDAQFSLEHLKRMHLEFRYPFTQIFTDALIQAMYQAVSLELWYVLMQALEPASYGEVRSKVSEYLRRARE